LLELPPLAVLQLVAALAAVIAGWALSRVSHDAAVWLLVGAGASGTYWLVAAATVWLALRMRDVREDLEPPPGGVVATGPDGAE
jgi:hypothetical protein